VTTSVAERLEELISPAGLVTTVRQLESPPGDPAFAVYSAQLGDLGAALPELRRTGGLDGTTGISGAGSHDDPATARWLSVAEALERYATCVYSPDQFIWATAAELGDEALDVTRCPRVSANEQAHPGCFAVPPDPDAPMRWVRGVSLMSGRRVWVPAVLVYLHLPVASPGERFTIPISTGCAAHTDLHRALAKGMCEVVERDAVALTWLQRLALPEIEVDLDAEPLAGHLRKVRGNPRVRIHLYDATTDLGIPTVYGVEVSPHHPRVRTVVNCAADPDPVEAVSKVLREIAAVRIALRHLRPSAADPDDFSILHDGALFMAEPQRAGRFDFLLAGGRRRPLSALPRHRFDDGLTEFTYVRERLAAAGHEAFAVDLTTDEADRVGVTVVKVLVPSLQPLTFAPRVQFRAHPRLYQAPAAMGHPVHAEAELNPWPQPFA
jgi:ribosomal protein S12 methylthiotransferase accessory factor